MQGIVFNSYAKLNLFLHITGVRDDGYHLIESVFCGVSFGDTVTVKKSESLTINCNIASLEHENNLARIAAREFFRHTGIVGGVDIHIKKRIPMQSGLGGGSSNAGGTLIALNELFDTRLTQRELAEIGVTIGADVPFFIYGNPSFVTGIGEELTPVKNNLAAFYLVIKPTCGIDTAECFRMYDALPKPETYTKPLVAAIEAGDMKTFVTYAKNVLMPGAMAMCPDIGKAIDLAYESGALTASMTGSGSAVYAVFEERDRALAAMLLAKEMFPFACVISARDSTYEPIEYIG